jgi:hypothetical protein
MATNRPAADEPELRAQVAFPFKVHTFASVQAAS